MRSSKLFRAFYKPDLLTKHGAIKFEQTVFEDWLCFEHDEIRYDFTIPFIDDDWEVQQWTGYTDKNGVKIFEGDFIRSCSGNWGEVIFDKGEFKHLADEGHPWIHLLHEVIGNTYEGLKQ